MALWTSATPAVRLPSALCASALTSPPMRCDISTAALLTVATNCSLMAFSTASAAASAIFAPEPDSFSFT